LINLVLLYSEYLYIFCVEPFVRRSALMHRAYTTFRLTSFTEIQYDEPGEGAPLPHRIVVKKFDGNNFAIVVYSLAYQSGCKKQSL